MVRYSIEDVSEGMTLGEPVFSKSNKLLIAAGVELKPVHILALKEMSVDTVLVDVVGTESILPEKPVFHATQNELTATLESSAKQIRTALTRKASMHETIHSIISNQKKLVSEILRNSGVLTAVLKIIDDIITEPWTLLNLNKLIETNEDVFLHTVQVTTIALCIGHKYRLSPEELRQLALGAINYDIGLLAVPKEIMTKASPLTADEESIIRKHPEYGYAMLSGVTSIPATSSLIILSHHEQQNGEGYPNKTKGSNLPPIKRQSADATIHRFAEIVAVADSFEMMAHGRLHFSPEFGVPEAIRRIIASSGTLLNADIVKTLVSFIAVYPVGTRVQVVDGPLSDIVGCRGVVAKVDVDAPGEPEIFLYESKSGQRIKPICIDCKRHKGFTLEIM